MPHSVDDAHSYNGSYTVYLPNTPTGSHPKTYRRHYIITLKGYTCMMSNGTTKKEKLTRILQIIANC